ELVRPIPDGQPVPGLNFPKPFLEPSTPGGVRTPGLKATGPVPVQSANPSVPVESLVQSLVERPLTGTSSGGGANSYAPSPLAPAPPAAEPPRPAAPAANPPQAVPAPTPPPASDK